MWCFLKGRALILLMVLGYFLPSLQRNIYISFHSKLFCPLISVENRDCGFFKHCQVKSVGDYNMIRPASFCISSFHFVQKFKVRSTLQIQEAHKIAAKIKKKALKKKKEIPSFLLCTNPTSVGMGAFGVRRRAGPRCFVLCRSSHSSCDSLPFLLQQKS